MSLVIRGHLPPPIDMEQTGRGLWLTFQHTPAVPKPWRLCYGIVQIGSQQFEVEDVQNGALTFGLRVKRLV